VVVSGIFFILLGVIGYGLALGAPTFGSVTFGVHTLLVGSLLIMVGYQAIQFAVFTKTFAITEGLMPADARMEQLWRLVDLERGLIIGATLAAVGCSLIAAAVAKWWAVNFGPLDYKTTMPLVIPGVLMVALGCQTIFSSFFLSILGLGRK